MYDLYEGGENVDEAGSEWKEIEEGRGADGCVLLDLTHLGAKKIHARLPGSRELAMVMTAVAASPAWGAWLTAAAPRRRATMTYTPTPEPPVGCDKADLVAMIPAMRAVAITSPFLALPETMRSSVAAFMVKGEGRKISEGWPAVAGK